MTRTLLAEDFGINLDAQRERFVFAGDSPNDAPMFGYFPNAVGVANVHDHAATMDHLPRWITARRSGAAPRRTHPRLRAAPRCAGCLG